MRSNQSPDNRRLPRVQAMHNTVSNQTNPTRIFVNNPRYYSPPLISISTNENRASPRPLSPHTYTLRHFFRHHRHTNRKFARHSAMPPFRASLTRSNQQPITTLSPTSTSQMHSKPKIRSQKHITISLIFRYNRTPRSLQCLLRHIISIPPPNPIHKSSISNSTRNRQPYVNKSSYRINKLKGRTTLHKRSIL